jgi:hypothetical protein
MAFRVVGLADVGGWQKLETFLAERQTNTQIVPTLVAHLKALNALSALVEEEYIDRDFSEAYSAYYAKTFRRHSKLCTRVLFFASDVTFLNLVTDVLDAATRLSQQPFLGQVVLRPISGAPLGQALLLAPPAPPTFEGELLVRARYTAHVFGAELALECVPMTQQDSRIGACAQATVWVAARHFHVRHRGPWLSTVSITRSAIAGAEAAVNLHVPAGSEFLTLNNIVAALRAADREPLIYAKRKQGVVSTWGATPPADVINRYVDSGIPVIVGIELPGQHVGHAIIATGRVLRATPRSTVLPARPTQAEYCECFYANDDQIGPNVRVPIQTGSLISEVPYSILDNSIYLLIPLPGKVYLPAEKAEVLAWNSISNYATDWPDFKKRHTGKLGSSEQLGDKLVAELTANRVLARTYLTYGWRYKDRGIKNKFSNPVRQVIRNLEVPRFVYVTEFSTVDATSSRSKYQRHIFAHCLVDATAKHEDMDSVLLVHAPGFCSWHAHDASGSFRQSVAAVENSTSYYPKTRGEYQFENFDTAML